MTEIEKFLNEWNIYPHGSFEDCMFRLDLKLLMRQIRKNFAHELKETFNNETPSNYASTQPFFTLENARKLVDMVLEEQNK